MPKVYIINKALHDFSSAEIHGDLIYLSEKAVDPYATNNMFRAFYPILKHSAPDDCILITGLNIMNVIATSIFVTMHGKLNILIYNPETHRYKKRTLAFDNIINKEPS